MLQYDNSAFHYFAISTLVFYLVPSWYSIITRVYTCFSLSDVEIGAEIRTQSEKKKALNLKKEFKGIAKLKTPGFIVNTCVTILLTIVFVLLLNSIKEHGEVISFDPYQILEIDQGSEVKAIKKAFRGLSLKWHPDKNKNNPAAEAKFMLINKAYEALTDPDANQKWKEFGNPDGKQSLEVSIGLPSYLLDTENRNLVLLTYLLIMVIIIPFCVYKYYATSSKFGEKDVMYDSYSWFHHTLNEHLTIKSLPEILCGSAEFRQRNMPQGAEKDEVTSLLNQVRHQMQKPKYNHPVCVKGNVLLHVFLTRKTDALSPKFTKDLNFMLRYSNSLIEAMISICHHEDWLQTAITCINFGQYLAQACWIKDSTLLQLPYFTEEEVKHVMSGKQSVKNLEKYLKQPNESKKGVADLTQEQKEDVFKCCELLPQLNIQTKVFVDDDEDDSVYEGDLCTVRVTLERINLADGSKASLVHAPKFPYPKQEAWWILLATKEGKIIHAKKESSSQKIVGHDIKFLAPRPGEYEFDLYVKSNAYLGLDHKQKVLLKTLDASDLPEYVVHPDDAELDDEPTLFEDMMNTNVEEDSDSDESEDEEVNVSQQKKLRLKQARKANASDSDDSDDDEAEEVYTEK